MKTAAEYEAEQVAEEAMIKALVAANPKMIPGMGCVNAAKNIRIELKAAFPGIKFSVTTEKYSGGNSINISYTDGPLGKDVEVIVDKYSAGNFNGMDDIYEYNYGLWGEAFGMGKYIFVRRNYSDASVSAAIEAVAAEYGRENVPTVEDWREGRTGYTFPDEGLRGGYNTAWQDLIRQQLVKTA